MTAEETADEHRIEGRVMSSLARLIGDEGRARARARKLALLMEDIETDGPEGEVEVFRAAADPCRLRILNLLRDGELCVCEIMAALRRPQSSTSHHLSVLREAGLVKERRDGKWSYYRLADGAVYEMLKHAKALKRK